VVTWEWGEGRGRLEGSEGTKRKQETMDMIPIFDHGDGLRVTKLIKKYTSGREPNAHTCNPNYSGGRDQEDPGSKSAPCK
jgi:hypothetical protein